MVLFKFLILLMLINAISCDVYYITPDDGYCDNNFPSHHCDNLDNYLLNASKYFTAHTQMNFLPGTHYLSTNLSIKNAHNISLIGGTVNGIHATIQCSTKHLFIVMMNITQLTMKDMIITGCGGNISSMVVMPYHYGLHTVQLYHCSDVTMQNITILSRTIYDNLISINTMGHSVFYDITSAGVTLVYNNYGINITKKSFDSTSIVLIDNFQYICAITCPSSHKITIKLKQTWFNVNISIMNTKLCFQYYIISVDIFMIPYTHDVIQINQCTCTEVATKFDGTIALFEILDSTDYIGKGNIMVQIKNCNFTDINNNENMFIIRTISSFATIHIIDSSFMNISNVTILESCDLYKKEAILIKNTSFISISSPFSLFHLINQLLSLEGPVLFKGLKLTGNHPLFDVFHVNIHIYNYVEISNCSAATIIPYNLYIGLTQPATVNFTSITTLDHFQSSTFSMKNNNHVFFNFLVTATLTLYSTRI